MEEEKEKLLPGQGRLTVRLRGLHRGGGGLWVSRFSHHCPHSSHPGNINFGARAPLPGAHPAVSAESWARWSGCSQHQEKHGGSARGAELLLLRCLITGGQGAPTGIGLLPGPGQLSSFPRRLDRDAWG